MESLTMGVFSTLRVGQRITLGFFLMIFSTALIFGTATLLTFERFRAVSDKVKVVEELTHEIQALDSLLSRYLIDRDPVTRRSWIREHDIILKRIADSLETIGPRYVSRLTNIRDELVSLRSLFNSFVSSLEGKENLTFSTLGTSPEPVAYENDLMRILVSQMLTKSRKLQVDAMRLSVLIFATLDDFKRQVLIALGAMLTLIIGGGVLVALYTSRSIQRPISRLIDGAQIVGTGNLNHTVTVESKDEIGHLSQTFNKMTHELRTIYKSLEGEIADRKRAEEELKRHTTELAAVNKELEAFTYSVSHDLRAPLRSVGGFAGILLEDYPDKLDAQGKDYLRRMCEASNRMGQMIDDLLNLSRVTRIDMKSDMVNLSKLAQAIAEELQQTQPERKVEFDVEEGVIATGDGRLLGMVLKNLLENAWKFTRKRPSTRIELGLTQEDGQPVCFVRDNGAGFDMAYADKLFGAFQRLHGSDEFEGTGIGLATVQRIIHRHGGSIWAEGAVGQGATFYFTLSLKKEKEHAGQNHPAG